MSVSKNESTISPNDTSNQTKSELKTLGEIKQITPEKSDEKGKSSKIIFCIDISGSMANDQYNNPFKWTQTTNAYMGFIQDQQERNPHSEITVILFNDKITVIHKDVPIEEIKCFPENITPSGGTRLCDVIISATSDLKKDDDKRVFVVILTDGEDTESKTKPEHARARIKKLQEDGIEFIFLGANMDSFRAADTYGITYAANINLDNSNTNINNVTRKLSDTICQLVRTRSNMEDCPALLRAYTSPENYDSGKYALPQHPIQLTRQPAMAIGLYGSGGSCGSCTSDSSDEIPPLALLTRSASMHISISKNI